MKRSHRDLRTIRTLLPYLWPKGEPELRLRVVLALTCLLAAKAATVYVPILYKRAVDILAPEDPGVVLVPVALIVAYGVVRVASAAFAELRDALFAKVGQRAIRRVGRVAGRTPDRRRGARGPVRRAGRRRATDR